MEVGVEHGQESAVFVIYLVGRHVGVIDRDVRVFLERDAVEPCGQPEHALFHACQFEIRAEHFPVNVVFLQLQLVGVVAEVPRLQDEIRPFALAGGGFHGLHLFAGGGEIGLQQVVEQLIDVLAVFRHALLQHEVGKRAASQQLCAFAPQVDDAFDDFRVVVFAPTGADGVFGHVHFFAQFPVVRVSHERVVARRVEREEPSFESLFLGGRGGGVECRFRQSGQVLFPREVELEGVGGFQVVL